MLVERGDRVMPEIKASLAAFAERELRGRGMEIRTGTTVERVAADHVELAMPDGTEPVPARTVAWTAGVRPHPVVERLGLPLGEGGRIVVDRHMQVQGHQNVWAIGDAAAVPDPARKGHACPPTCQHSLRQGKRVARNVAAALGTAGSAPSATARSECCRHRPRSRARLGGTGEEAEAAPGPEQITAG